MVSYPTVNAGGWLNENPEEPEGCAGAAGAGGFAPKVNTPGLFGKLKFEFILSSKILTFFPLPLINFFYGSLTVTKLGEGHAPEVPDYYRNSTQTNSFTLTENHKGILEVPLLAH